MIRRTLAALAILALTFVPVASAEIWNDPGGRTVTDTSQTVTFPRAMFDVLVQNDDAAEPIYVRVFWCWDPAIGQKETVAVATTDSLEIQGGKWRSFTYRQGENGSLSKPGYCAMTVISTATGADIRIEAK